MKMIGLIVFFFSLGIKSAYNQTPLSKEQILELYKSWESQKRPVLEFSDADSLLNMSLAHIFDSLQASNVDSILISSTVFIGYAVRIRRGTEGAGGAPFKSVVIWTKNGITHIRKISDVRILESSSDTLDFFQSFELQRPHLETEIVMPVVISCVRNVDSTISCVTEPNVRSCSGHLHLTGLLVRFFYFRPVREGVSLSYSLGYAGRFSSGKWFDRHPPGSTIGYRTQCAAIVVVVKWSMIDKCGGGH